MASQGQVSATIALGGSLVQTFNGDPESLVEVIHEVNQRDIEKVKQDKERKVEKAKQERIERVAKWTAIGVVGTVVGGLFGFAAVLRGDYIKHYTTIWIKNIHICVL